MDLPWEPLPCQAGYFMIADVTKCRDLIPKIYFQTHECESGYDAEKAKTDSNHIVKNILYVPGSEGAIPLDLAFARWMAIENGVAVMPCCIFYPQNSPGMQEYHVRLAICRDLESTKKCCERLRKLKFPKSNR